MLQETILMSLASLVRVGQRDMTAGQAPAAPCSEMATASSQGFHQPLLAYSQVRARFAEQKGDQAALADIRRHIEPVYRSLPVRQ